MTHTTSRVAFHEDTLRRLEERERVLSVACNDARETIRRTHAELAAAEADLQDVRDRAAHLRVSIDGMRSREVAAMPDELLRMVFAQSAADVADRYAWDDGGACADVPPDAAILYTLATVCRRWRHVATSMPKLWSLLAIPGATTAEGWAALLLHVETTIQRSGHTPLDVVIVWPSLVLPGTAMYDVLDTIGRAARRWRRFSFIFPYQLASPAALDMFRRPSPGLETLAVVRGSPKPTDSPVQLVGDDALAHYLPHCPKLRKLTTRGYIVMCSSPLLPLVKLVLSVNNLPDDSVVQILRLLPSLQHLDVALTDDAGDFDVADTSTLYLAALEHLACRTMAVDFFNRHADMMELPRLRVLELEEVGSEVDNVGNLLALVAETVTEFRCGDPGERLCEDQPEWYSALRNVRDLHLQNWSDIHRSFFSYVAENNVWPKLESIAISSSIPFDTPADAEAFASFVQSRAASTSGGDGTEVPCKLTRVDVSKCLDVPEWLVDQIDFFLGPGQ